MQSTERERLDELVAAWLTMHRQPVDVTTLNLWWVALEHCTWPQVARAIREAMRDPEIGRYPPVPAHVLAKIPAPKPEYHVKPQLPDIARGSGMAGILDHLESKQERNSRGHRWIAKMRADLAKRAER